MIITYLYIGFSIILIVLWVVWMVDEFMKSEPPPPIQPKQQISQQVKHTETLAPNNIFGKALQNNNNRLSYNDIQNIKNRASAEAHLTANIGR